MALQHFTHLAAPQHTPPRFCKSGSAGTQSSAPHRSVCFSRKSMRAQCATLAHAPLKSGYSRHTAADRTRTSPTCRPAGLNAYKGSLLQMLEVLASCRNTAASTAPYACMETSWHGHAAPYGRRPDDDLQHPAQNLWMERRVVQYLCAARSQPVGAHRVDVARMSSGLAVTGLNVHSLSSACRIFTCASSCRRHSALSAAAGIALAWLEHSPPLPHAHECVTTTNECHCSAQQEKVTARKRYHTYEAHT